MSQRIIGVLAFAATAVALIFFCTLILIGNAPYMIYQLDWRLILLVAAGGWLSLGMALASIADNLLKKSKKG